MGISVVIPVGPKKEHANWLDECLASIEAQTRKPNEVVFIDDMADIPFNIWHGFDVRNSHISVVKWDSPWHLGVAHAFNMGVGLATKNCVLLLGADDTLEPDCIEQCLMKYQESDPFHREGYYYLGVRYMDTGEEQSLPCGAAMVTKGLWRRNGGFPVETAVGASDAALISVMMVHREAGRLIPVNDEKPLYNYRRHQWTDTSTKGPWQGVILETRGILTSTWTPPDWRRFV